MHHFTIIFALTFWPINQIFVVILWFFFKAFASFWIAHRQIVQNILCYILQIFGSRNKPWCTSTSLRDLLNLTFQKAIVLGICTKICQILLVGKITDSIFFLPFDKSVSSLKSFSTYLQITCSLLLTNSKHTKKCNYTSAFIPQCSEFHEDKNYVLHRNPAQHSTADLKLQHHSM